MFDFCPHCGETIGQDQSVVGMEIKCRHCGHVIGTVSAAPKKVILDDTEKLLQGGTAARCAVCQQIVQVKTSAGGRSLVPHFDQPPAKKMCAGSGKPVVAPAPKAPPPSTTIQGPVTSKDLSGHYTRDLLRVVACRMDCEPTIEELTLAYLDKSDRVRIQIDALREMLGKDFRMKAYPNSQRPDLGLWGNADQCVVARKHPQGGIASLSDTEIRAVIEDLHGDRVGFYR